MDTKKFFLLGASLFCVLAAAQNKLVINELMQSNVDFLMVNHDFPDSWVELYNGGSNAVSIGQYRIGASDVYGEAFQLHASAVSIEPGQYLILYCDKTTGIPFHYNFNLEASKGELYLFDETGQAIDSVRYPKMPAPNVAYGRVTDSSGEWHYELTPSPGLPNSSIGSQEVLPAPLFSAEGHLMTNGAESISVSLPEGVPEDTRIYITTDGSEPTWESENDTLFTINVDTSTVIRAKLLSSQMLPSRSTTHSYIFHPRDTKLPIVCIATDDAFLFSSEEGILSNDSTDGMSNCKYDWRRPANFEYFNTENSTTVFNQSGEMAVGGALSRLMPQKSIKCYAKNRFGKKKFKGDFWHDKPGVTSVKSFMLRNGGNNCLKGRIDDAIIQRFFGTNIEEMDWQAYEPVIVYINGVYKGVYGFRERSNEDYVASNYEVDDKEVEIAIDNNYRSNAYPNNPYFNVFNTLYHRSDVTYEEMTANMNVENFMNAFIAECFSSNTDFPQNNVAIWRQNGEGNKWNWIVKDLDFVSKHNASWNMFNYMLGTNNPEDEEYDSSNQPKVVSSRFLYEKMMSFPEFRNRFIATYATYLGDFLRPDVCLPIVNEMEAEILDEIAPTFAAYDNMSTLNKHKNAIKSLCNYITERPAQVYQQMADYFSLGDVIPVNILNDENESRTISVCDTPLRTGQFRGAWFTGFPLTVSTKSSDAVWAMTVTHADGSSDTYNYNTAEIQPDLSQCAPDDSATIMVTNNNTTNIVEAPKINTIEAIYDLTGKKNSAKQQGMNIILYSDGTRRKIINQ